LEFLFRLLLFANFCLFGDTFFTFGEDHFNMARMGHEWVDSTMCPINPPSITRSFIDSNVFDIKSVSI